MPAKVRTGGAFTKQTSSAAHRRRRQDGRVGRRWYRRLGLPAPHPNLPPRQTGAACAVRRPRCLFHTYTTSPNLRGQGPLLQVDAGVVGAGLAREAAPTGAGLTKWTSSKQNPGEKKPVYGLRCVPQWSLRLFGVQRAQIDRRLISFRHPSDGWPAVHSIPRSIPIDFVV